MKIGIFGGTFDPCTVSHYEIVKKVLDDKLVDRVIVMPTIVDYYRKDKFSMFSCGEREQILHRWFDNVPNVTLDFKDYYITDEFVRKNRRYIHMLRDVQERYDPKNKNEFYTIVGGDSWNNIESWTDYEHIFELSKFIVVRRNGDKLKDVFLDYEVQDEEGYWTVPDIVIELDKRFENVSATKIRMRLMEEITVMSHGNTTKLDLYLDEIDEYLETGKIYEDIDRHIDMIQNKLLEKIHSKKNDMSTKAENDFNIDMTDLKNKIDKFIDKKKNEYSSPSKKDKETHPLEFKDKSSILIHTSIFDVIEGEEVEEGFKPIRVNSKDWVAIAVEDKNGMFLVEKQLRHGTQNEYHEFPCGVIEDGEQPIAAALRELREETGLEPLKYSIRYLGKHATNPGFMTNHMYYFYIKLDKYLQWDKQLDPHEHITWKWTSKNEFMDIFDCEHGSALMGCMWMLLIKTGIVDEWDD